MPEKQKTHHNLLTEPLIRIISTSAEGAEQVSHHTLPGIFALMMRDEVNGFPALRPHQQSAWHMFLAQLGGLALEQERLLTNNQITLPPTDESEWARLLRQLTQQLSGLKLDNSWQDAPWCLVVENDQLPAFLQPPIPGGISKTGKGVSVVTTPDGLDLPIAAKNHDLKRQVLREAAADDWIFALISDQTMNGYTGRGHQGAARMNGGLSSRPFFGYAPLSGRPGAHLKRDLELMLRERPKQLETYEQTYGSKKDGPLGKALLWLEPWDGKKGLPFNELDLWFIDLCRRIRLIHTPSGKLEALEATADTTRIINAKDRKGDTGDFWAPLESTNEGPKSFSPTAQGFTTSKICEILFSTDDKKTASWILPPALSNLPTESKTSLLLRLSALTRGQGKTEGYHERVIPLAPLLRKRLSIPSERVMLGRQAREQLVDLSCIEKALSTACAQMAAGGEEVKKDHYAAVNPYRARLRSKSDEEFFSVLGQRCETPEKEAKIYEAWLVGLVDYAAKTLLPEAQKAIPCPAIRRLKAQVKAENAFWNVLLSKKSSFTAQNALLKKRVSPFLENAGETV
ncbi:CRISPR-associated protein Cse1 [Oecophyllibacter saccharovorans]|uniref:CRISPR-associated protein Cse1 n=1 Tax=Oecophyllibacter saccharovorans TaxID=2558360 RepID=UPI001143A94F|nr:CRISPR-associated protein Cse1 [Oecophyllibacter saccharovorans]QDH14857.1 CRISPR-associated protein Cse1 [Oecophyllibacter saccharovorans]